MKNRTFKGLLVTSLSLGATLLLAACGANGTAETTPADSASSTTVEQDVSTVGLAVDFSGIDDKSFNQSAWEGLQEWGAENGLEKGREGFDYIQAESASDYVMNLSTLAKAEFDTVVAMGFRMGEALAEVAPQNPDTNFAIIDMVVPNEENVASLVFNDNESAFLAGVAAADSTETGKIGFIGGQESETIDRFEAGYVQGAKSVNPDIEVQIDYVGSFADAAKGKSLAGAMYSNGVDIIYAAAGDSGNGVFTEAKDRMNSDSTQNLWVVGGDRDQTAEGQYDNGSVTLTSSLKRTGNALKDIANQAAEGNFPGGEVINYGLAEDGVGLTEGQLTEETLAKVEDYKQQIIDGTLEVDVKPAN